MGEGYREYLDSTLLYLFKSLISLNLMQPGPDSIGIVAVSRNCNGVAARACGLVSLEPMKVLWIIQRTSIQFRVFSCVLKIYICCRWPKFSKIVCHGFVTAVVLMY